MKTIATIYGKTGPYLVEVFVESTEGTTFICQLHVADLRVCEPTEDCPCYEIDLGGSHTHADEVRRM